MITYIYDGSFQGLLSAIYDSFYSKIPPNSILAKNEYSIDLLSTYININTDYKKYKKVKESIILKIDRLCLEKIYKLYLSSEKDKGILCFKYLKLAFKVSNKIHSFLHLDIVRNINLIDRRVSLEAHRFTGLVRFSYIGNKFLYSQIYPDNNILELISPHFEKRLPNEYWIIHDTKRNIATIYNKVSWEITELDKNDYMNLSKSFDNFEELWKEYFKSTTIDERLNLKPQKRSMPKRYWKNLTELK